MKKSQHLSEKLELYLRETGIKQSWIANKLKIGTVFFNHIVKGNNHLPLQYWRALIEITNGFITPFDLIKDKFESIGDELEFKVSKNFNECIVSLKDLKTEIVKKEFNC